MTLDPVDDDHNHTQNPFIVFCSSCLGIPKIMNINNQEDHRRGNYDGDNSQHELQGNVYSSAAQPSTRPWDLVDG